ncbi:MAG: CoA pyrophosphatase [Anaerolineales bacterium]|nr:MAG: CoA pyrophosphatase [Anaerolineales bacterium]
MDALTEEFISSRLAESYGASGEDSCYKYFLSSNPRPAAVLIPLFFASPEDKQEHRWQVLLTRRTEGVAEHQGQVAFPGGRADPTDLTPESTALREAYEEIGLEPTSVRILGKMKELPTISNYCITPVVGVIPWPFEIRLEETEVSRVFSIPLDWLFDPTHHETRYRTIPEPFSKLLKMKSHPVIYFQTYQEELLWGVSAQITVDFIEILRNKKRAGA